MGEVKHTHWFALHSTTGVNIGLWQDGYLAEIVKATYPGSTITELVEITPEVAVAPEMLAELDKQHAWLLHWRDDVKGGLKPTLESLEKRLEAVVALKDKAMGADNV